MLGQGVLLGRVDLVALEDAAGILAAGESRGLVEPLVLVDALANQAKVLRRRGKGGDHAHVVEVIAGQVLRPVVVGREHHDARQGHVRLAQVAHENGATHGAVRLAKDVERRTPAVVLVKPLADGAAEGARVLLEAIDALGVVALSHEGPACAQGVREDEV